VKIALISDIHGNTIGLRAVLEDVRAQRPDRILCLGDLAYGPAPSETFAALREAGVECLAGNGDDWNRNDNVREALEEARPRLERAKPELDGGVDGLIAKHLALNAWIRDRLDPAARADLARLPDRIRVDLGGGLVLLCYHATPRDYLGFLKADTPDDVVATALEGTDASIYAGGHTHTSMLRSWNDRWLVNVGSVGYPEQAPARAGAGLPTPQRLSVGYVLLTVEGDVPRLEFRRVPVERAAVAALVRESGLPDADWYFAPWLAG
jgi:predicted phosphodiesterase